MTIKEARLILKMAFEAKNESDMKGLIAVADKMLAESEKQEASSLEQVNFPINIFRRHKGELYKGELLKGWRVALNGDVFNSPSAAAVFVSGHPENGWRMWRYIDEKTNTEYPIDRIRRMVNRGK